MQAVQACLQLTLPQYVFSLVLLLSLFYRHVHFQMNGYVILLGYSPALE
jgi:hypothetical protein